ncbi:MAG: hypothetical protein DI565_17295 [Ancylobacter novellus]|uniref:Rv0623 family protein transcription factor n=1 Tax=Ancylobacter novellus TaxID=921 RepID=A0A2W5K8S7_ANCNO|nr:MAG: hypothetical protein DI565_17295 [Ancylobacter novellus]
MVLNIRNPRADALARELAELKGTSITEAVVTALDDAVRARRKRKTSSEIVDEILKKYGITLTEEMRKPTPQKVWDEIHDHESFDP